MSEATPNLIVPQFDWKAGGPRPGRNSTWITEGALRPDARAELVVILAPAESRLKLGLHAGVRDLHIVARDESPAIRLECLQQRGPSRRLVLAEKINRPHIRLRVHVRLAREDNNLQRLRVGELTQ